MILLISDFMYLTFFKFHKLLTYTNLNFHQKTIPKKAPKHIQRVEHSSAKNVPDRRLIKKKKKAMEEVEKIGGQNALNALNALNVHHLKNVPGRRPMKKKKVTKEIKREEKQQK